MIKKKISVMLAAAMFATCMSGCGKGVVVEDMSGSTVAEAETTESTSEETTATVTEATSEAATEATTEMTTEEAAATPTDAPTGAITFDIKSNNLFEISDDGKTLFDGSYDEIEFDESTKTAYPALVESVKSYTTSIMHEVGQMKDDNIAEIRQRYSEDPETQTAYSDNNSLTVRRVDSDVVSFKADIYTYTGGAHGWYGSGGANFDVKTGKELKLSDVIKDREALITCVQDKLRKYYPDLIEAESGIIDMVVEDFSETNSDNISWCIDPEGITLFFNPYELGSYAAGMQVIPIAFSENPELFKDSIHKQEGNWAFSASSAYLDTDGNGTYEKISIQEDNQHEVDYDYIKGVKIVVNDNETPFEFFSYKNAYNFIKSGSNYFLYVTALEENDWKSTHVYKLAGDTVTEVGAVTGYISASKIEYDYDEAGFSAEMTGCMYNPDCFYFGNRMNALSTYSGIRLSKVGADGMPAPVENWYKAYAQFEITSKVNLELDEVDEAGNVIKKEKLESGTQFTFHRTDGETYVDLLTHKGTIYRVPIDTKEWPQKINGKDVEEIFDGLVFAG